MICVKTLLLKIGYKETTWKATRTRLLGDKTIEQIDEKTARQLLDAIGSQKQSADNKDRVLNAQKILGNKSYLNMTLPSQETKVDELEKANAEIERLKKELDIVQFQLKMLNGLSQMEV